VPVRLLQPGLGGGGGGGRTLQLEPPPCQPPVEAAKKKRKLDEDLGTPRIDNFLTTAPAQHKRPKEQAIPPPSPPRLGVFPKAVSTNVTFSLARCREGSLGRRSERPPQEAIVGCLDETNLVGSCLEKLLGMLLLFLRIEFWFNIRNSAVLIVTLFSLN
jgi:hypothetical protein